MNPLLNSKQLEEAVKNLSQKRLNEFLEGVRLYNKHLLNYQGQNRLQGETVWQQGSARLIDYGGNTPTPSLPPKGGGSSNESSQRDDTSFSPSLEGRGVGEGCCKNPSTAIFLIPSLINKPYIFDVSEEKSFIRFLKKQGFRVFLMDWGNPSEAEHGFSCTDYIEKYLIPAFDELEQYIAASYHNNSKLITVGYCLGGLFALALAQTVGKRIDGLGLLASPWDFSSDDIWHLPDTEALKQSFELYQIVPSIFLQSMFIILSSFNIEEKFRKLSSCKDVKGFMAIEEWLNDSVDLTSDAAKELFIDWVHNNKPFNKKWKVKGKAVNPAEIETNTFIAVPLKDQIVPPSCSKPLNDIMPNNHLLELKAGHIGMLVGNQAKEKLWQPFVRWAKNL